MNIFFITMTAIETYNINIFKNFTGHKVLR